jgi:hypothetical protein
LPEYEDFGYVLNLITLLAVRHPVMRRSMAVARQSCYRAIAELLASNRTLYEHHLKMAREGGFVSGADVPFERMREFLRKGEYRFEISPHDHLRTELAAFEGTLRTVSSRYWSLLVAKAGAPDFITCDRPVSLAFRDVVLPLGPRHCIIGGRERAPLTMILNESDVSEVNWRIVMLADRQVYSRTSEVAFLVHGKVVRKPLAQVARSLCSKGSSVSAR